MKKLLIAVSLMIPLAALSQSSNLPYKARESSSFAMGDPTYSEKVLWLWKDFDDNTFEKHDFFSDTAVVIMANGMLIKGKANVFAGIKGYRSSLKKVSASVDAYTTLFDKTKNMNMVLIWGVSRETDQNGKETVTQQHEVWAFNKDGKVAWMKQYAGL
jgi:hypothetical protein